MSWEVICAALRAGMLGPVAKRSTARVNPTQVDMKSAMIVIYTKDWTNKKDLDRIEKQIRFLGFKQKLFYKKDITTRQGIYGPKSWYLQRELKTVKKKNAEVNA